MSTVSPISDTLRRHQSRRASGVPTVTTLVGPTGLGVRAWRKWVEVERRPCAVTTASDPDAFLPTWVESVFTAAPPAHQASQWVATITGRNPEAVPREVGAMTYYDLDQLARSLPIDPHRPGVVAAFRLLQDRATGNFTDPGRFAREIAGAAGPTDGSIRVVRAVTELYPPGLWPALLLVRPAEAPDDWGLSAARVLERIAAAEPRLPVALALDTEEYSRLLARSPDSRAAALVREGFVELRGVSGNQLEERLRAAGVRPLPTATASHLAADGLAEVVATAFVEAARVVRNPSPAELESDFRSVHEEFVFELLESMPRTAGLFRPNHPLDFRHGHQAAEADLLADSLKLVVEVDGGHYHLTADQYRRDRRKDWLYQRHGYLVLRFLAEDVVGDIEQVLDTILEAVELRRASTHPTGAA